MMTSHSFAARGGGDRRNWALSPMVVAERADVLNARSRPVPGRSDGSPT
jgi:hypothetical protein